ncbi:MAG: xanthine dehydrogenase family protein molybdopterin-binding subunit [Rhodospirillales bacterium]|nr:xanthine dehydrogenase family protein molybdopterin-binding subunit [Rhodospirillales bacterium]
MADGPDGTGIGGSVRRWEDARFLTGRGRYVDDLRVADAAHMVVVRSPFAAARITAIDTAAARAMPGVLAVLTAADVREDGIARLHTIVARQRRDGSPMPRPPFSVLADAAVRFVGDAVACVIAETRNAALDAAECVEVSYQPLPAVTTAGEALAPGAPAVWPDHAPDNLCFVFSLGDRAATDAAFAAADHVTRLPLRVSRVAAQPMETRNAIGLYDPVEQRYTLHAGVQIPHKIRTELAERTLGIPPSRLRVISPDTGGGFGLKGSPFPEHVLVLWAARKIGRPVRWSAGRSEAFLSDFHARDTESTIELALSGDGLFQALRIRTMANLGAYLGFNTPHSSTNNLGGLAGVYRTPHIHAEVLGAFTHTQPNAPYRGAGRPEASYALERVIDVAADELGLDRVAIRRRNLIPPEAMPFRTGLVFTYDSGDFARGMALALEAADWSGFAARRAASLRRGRLRGIGIANAIEIAGGPARTPNEEGAEIRFDPGGDATFLLGSHNHGQGHETVFRQIAHTLLGLDPARVRIVAGDTDQVMHGRGTFGSRSVLAVGAALSLASERIIARGRAIAAHLLEAAEPDIIFADGLFAVAGTDRGLSISEVARASFETARLPRAAELGLFAQAVVTPDDASFPNGCHVCEVEIDPETGATQLVAYVVVDDVGTVINPLLVKGQVHGGVAQGAGQALLEQIVFDEAGQMLTGSFMDYAMPRADHLPAIDVIANPVPTASNPLGAKGAGEAGTVGALPVVINAVVDALRPLGVRHIDMPATPARIWAALRDARAGAALPEPGVQA